MRLLNITTLKLREFFELEVEALENAILSHRWLLNEEVTFQELQSNITEHEKKSGYAKISICCKQAQQDGIDWAWIDTCCTDLTSCAELSESINSMFRSYHNAKICYAYLARGRRISLPASPYSLREKLVFHTWMDLARTSCFS